MKWFSVLLFVIASLCGCLYFCTVPLMRFGQLAHPELWIVLGGMLFIPLGRSAAFRFGASLVQGALWGACAALLCPAWNAPETVFSACVWLLCFAAAIFSIWRVPESVKTCHAAKSAQRRSFYGKKQLQLFTMAWGAGYFLFLEAISPLHALFFFMTWSLVMLFVAQMWFWPLAASHGWVGHDERRILYVEGKKRLYREIKVWIALLSMIAVSLWIGFYCT